MKIPIPWLLVPVAMGAGFFAGRQGREPDQEVVRGKSQPRETRVSNRGKREDPFGGPSFSLASMDEVRELFKKHGYNIASARLTLKASTVEVAEIPAMMEMLQQDARDNPNDYFGRYELMNTLFERWVATDPTGALAFIDTCKTKSFRTQAASYCFSALARENPDRMMVEFAKLPKGDLRSQAGMAIMGALGETDPAAACNFIEKEGVGNEYGSYYTANVLGKWAKTDPEAAAARLATMPPNRVDEESAGQVASAWARKDPEAALAWAKSLKGEWKSGATVEIYKVLSREDPAAAWERLKGEPGHLRGKLIGGVLEIVADEDTGKAVAMLRTLETKSEKRIAVGQLMQQSYYGYSSARLGFDLMEQLDDPAIRKAQLGQMMSNAAWGSPEVFKEEVAKMSEREKIDTASSVMRGLMRTDPREAEKYYLDLPEAQRGTQSLTYLMESYVENDPKKAFDFAISLANPQEQTAALNGVFSSWSQEDPEAAAEGWKKLPAGQGRLETLDGIASSWSGSDPVAAKAWAESLTGAERTRALAAVLPALARDNPAAAASQLATLISSPPDGMEKNLASSAAKLAGSWADDDPAGAAKWVASLPEGQSRDQGLSAVSRSWSNYDAIATAEWLGTLESGSARDSAIQPLVARIRQTDPDTAFSWAASISDETERLNQLRQTLSTWRKSDLAGARDAFNAANLTDKEIRSLSKELE